MKKAMLTALLALTVTAFGVPAVLSAEVNCEKPNCGIETQKQRPALYDAKGNKLTCPPAPGQKVYDAKGNELKMPPRHKEFKGPELNLTEAQKAKADKIREASRKTIKPIFEETRKLHDQIAEIQNNTALSEEAKQAEIKKIKTKLFELKKKADEIRKADMEKFEKLLTKEQKAILEEFKKNHSPEKMRNHRKHCGCGCEHPQPRSEK